MPALADEFALPDVAAPAAPANLLDEFSPPEPRHVEDLTRDVAVKANEWNRTWKAAETPGDGLALIGKWFGEKAGAALKGVVVKDWDEANTPKVNLPRLNVPSEADTPESMRPMQKPASVIAGTYNAVAGVAESLTTPLNIGTLGAFGALNKVAAGTGPAARVAQKTLAAVKLYFGAEMAKTAGGQAGAASVTLADPNASLQQKTEAAVAPVVTAGMAIISAASGGKDVAEITAPRPKVTPKTTAELATEFAPPETPLPDAKAPPITVESIPPESRLPPEAPPTETGAIQYTIQRPQEFEGRTVPGYTQVERQVNAGRGEPLTDAETEPHKALSDEAIAVGIPTGQYTEAQLREFIASKAAPPSTVAAEFTAPPASLGSEAIPKGGATLEPTSIKNAIVDQERVARGLPPAMQEAARDFPGVWDEAMKRVEENPEVGDNLVADLKQKARPLSDVEDAILLRFQINAQNEFAEVSRRISEGRGTPEELANDRLAQTQLANDLLDVYNVGKKAGTESGRGLNARKMLADENYTLGQMVTLRRALKGGAELTPEEMAQTEKLQAKIDELQTKFDAYRARASELLMSDKPAPQRKSVGGRVVAALSEQAVAARARIKARLAEGRVSAGIDPADVADYAIIGADYIARGVAKAAEWGEAMVKEFGEQIRPHLAAIRTKAEETVGEVDFSSALEARKAQLQKRIDTLTKKIEENDLSVAARKASRPAVEELERLMQERDELQNTLGGMREEVRRVKELEVAIAEKTRKLTEGDLSTKPTAQNRPAPEEVEKLKRERDALNKDLAKARQEATKATPEEVLQRRVDAVNKKIAENREKIRTGNLAPESAPANRPAPPELEKARQELEAINAEIAELRKGPARPAEEVRTQAFKKRIAGRIAELEKRIENNDFAKRERRPVIMDEEANKLQAQLEAAKHEFDDAMEADRYQQMSAAGKVAAQAIAVYDLQRTIQTTGELSFILRQGAFSAASAPITTARAIPDAIRALFADPVTARAIDLKTFNHPDARAALKAGLSLVQEGERLSRQDELIGAKLLEKVPILRNFSHSARVFLNRLRFDIWRDMRNTLDNPTPAEEKQIAKFVNQSTGRGGLGRAEPLAIQLGRVLYSPRFLASRIQLAVGESMWGGNLRTRQAIAKRYAKFLVGAGAYYYAMSQLVGDEKNKPTIEWDSKSTDFGKVKVGDTRVDPLGGLAQVIVFGSRMATGETKNARGEIRKAEPGDTALRFARTKLAPIPGSIVNLYLGTDLAGNPATIANQSLNLVQPLSYMDIYQALKASDDMTDDAAFTLLSLLGQGLQTYDANQRRPRPMKPNPANKP